MLLTVNRVYREIRDDPTFRSLPPKATRGYFRRRMYEAIDSFPTRWGAVLFWMKRKLIWCFMGGRHA